MNLTRTLRLWWCLAVAPAGLPAVAGDSGPAAPAAGDDDATEVIILHTNDLHFDFNHLEHFSAAVEHFRQHHEHVFLLDAGDVLVRHEGSWPQPELDYYEERGREMIGLMNRLGYDAMALGNHELAYFDNVTRDLLREARFPLLGANVRVTTDRFDRPRTHTILESAGGVSLAVVGITSGSFGDRPGIELGPLDEAVERHLHLGEEHDVLVLLSHAGAPRDFGLAARFRALDVIIGGHSHTHLNPAPTINGVLVAQTGGHPHPVDADRRQHLGVIRLLVGADGVRDKTGVVLTFDGGEALLDELRSGVLLDWTRAVEAEPAVVEP